MSERQLTLDLAAEPSYAREDFLVAASNARAWGLFENWPNWPDRILTLVGPSGSGKTHLASIWAERAGAVVSPAAAMAPGASERLLRTGAALIEDADRAGQVETEVFHFLNRARADQAFVVLTARTPPDGWRLATPDLLSRLRQAPMVTLSQPDDELMRAVLVKLFVDRQLLVEAAVVDYIALHLDRSLDAARRVVDALDREALAQARRVTRPLAAVVLAQVLADLALADLALADLALAESHGPAS